MRGRVNACVAGAMWAMASAWAGADVLESIDWTKATSHSVLQSAGYSWTRVAGEYKYVVGVVLNDASDMVDGTPSSLGIGGQWQIAIQAVAGGDSAGTMCWLGQNYTARGQAFDYLSPDGSCRAAPNPQGTYWLEEMGRVGANDDVNGDAWLSTIAKAGVTLSSVQGATVSVGDLVVVRANAGLSYGGKLNINETHKTDPSYDFDICVLQKGYGVPAAKVLTVSEVQSASVCEANQSTWVTLSEVSVTDWTPSASGHVIVSDGVATFACKLGRNVGDVSGLGTAGTFSISGILNQESSGYELWVMSASDIVAVPEPMTGVLLAAMGVAVMRRKKDGWIS